YALQVGRAYLDLFAAEDIDPCGKTVLELGPGINFGSALVLACHGVRPIIADRFLANWDTNYHPKFYSALRKTLAEHDPAADLTPLDRLVEENAYANDGIGRIERSGEPPRYPRFIDRRRSFQCRSRASVRPGSCLSGTRARF